MGLEGVELVLDVEERFETSVPDTQAERIQTVGDLHSFLMNRIRSQNSDSCPSAAIKIGLTQSHSHRKVRR